MSKITFQKPGNFIYPVPAVMVSLRDASGKSNIITIAWTGTICSDPPMAYISVRKSRASYPMLVESGEFVINLPSEELVRALDYCGVRSLDQVDKWKEMNLHEGQASVVAAPTIEEAPVSIECKVTQVLPLGTHDMFLAEVVAVDVDDRYIDEKGSGRARRLQSRRLHVPRREARQLRLLRSEETGEGSEVYESSEGIKERKRSARANCKANEEWEISTSAI